jgi:alkanesulfonate monooxygenase SsuD/methylene tetrahydromethanopterin reductase-like flavin-dependent oxidoreductase (luciferase family)
MPQTPTIEQYSQAGLMFVGTPDQVYEQIADFNTEVGGFGHLLVMGQAGTLSHEDTVDNLTLFGKEVAPRLAELKPVDTSVKYETFA